MKLDFNKWILENRESIHLLFDQLKDTKLFKDNNLDISKFEYFCYLNSSKSKYKYT